jgi:hypothetical protein
MATMTTRDRARRIRSARLIAHERVAEIPGWEVAVDRLVGELVCAFFVAMALMWIVTTIAGIFS